MTADTGPQGDPAPVPAAGDAAPPAGDTGHGAGEIAQREALGEDWPAAAVHVPRPAHLRAAREDDIFVAATCSPEGVQHALLVLEAGARLLAGRLAVSHRPDELALPPDVRDALGTVARWILDIALPGST